MRVVTRTERVARQWVLKADELAIGYGHHAILHDLSFEVGQGEILGIVGPNGCGKTTLVRTMLGLLRPLAGRVRRQSGLTISYVPQRERIERMIPVTAFEVVLMGPNAQIPALQRTGRAERDAVDRALALLGIAPLKQELFRNLSTGQQQRVLLARALASDPDVLVLDEPTSGMDVASEAAIVDFLRELNVRRRVTIVIVTHLLPIVLNLASGIMLMNDGAILQGAVDEVLREDCLRALYGVPVRLGSVAGQRTLVVEQRTDFDV
jgi:iron/zinc/copper transport system ATP-binding protein